MGVIEGMAREMAKEIGSKTREFYEFVLPPVDIIVRDDEVVVTADMPGFDKNNMGVTLRGRMLRIQACKERDQWLRIGSREDNVGVGNGGDGEHDDIKEEDNGKASEGGVGPDPHDNKEEEVICAQRPSFIDKKIRLPPGVAYGGPRSDDGSVKGRQQPTATYEDGILTVSIPTKKRGGIDIQIQ